MEFIYPPIVGAIIGYITNWLAIKMLFKPQEEKKLLGIKLPFTPGVIPKERQRIAQNIGQAVGQHLLTEDVIKNKMLKEETQQAVANALMNTLPSRTTTIEQVLRLYYNEKYEEKMEQMVHWMTEELKAYVNDTALQKKITTQLVNGIQKQLEEVPMKDLLSSEWEMNIGSILEHKMPELLKGLKGIIENEAVETKIKAMISEFIQEKLGALGAMFVNSDTIYQNIMDKVDQQLENPETALWIKQQCLQVIKAQTDKTMQEVLTEEGAHSFIQWIERQIGHMFSENSLGEEISRTVQGLMTHLLKRELLITQEIRDGLEAFIKQQWTVLIDQHSSEIISNLNVAGMVEAEMNRLDINEIENLILLIVKKELSAITWFGALLGAIMGIVLNFV